jgi:DNA polymerase III delta prime subunit
MAQFEDSLSDLLDEIRAIAEHALALEVGVERGLSDQELEAEIWRKQIDFRVAVNRLYALLFADADDIRFARANEWVSIKDLPPTPPELISDELVPDATDATDEFEVQRRAVEARTTTAREIVAANKGEQMGRAL